MSSSLMKGNCKRSPRLSFNKVNLKNVTVRSRRKQKDTSSCSFVNRGETILTDSQVKFYERPAQGKGYARLSQTGELSNPSLHKVVNSDEDTVSNFAFSRQSCPKTTKVVTNFSYENTCDFDEYNHDKVTSKNLSKCLFNSGGNKIKECVTCKKQFQTISADVHCDGSRNKASNIQASVRNSRVSDVESSSTFQPQFSSTRVYKTPVCSRLQDERNLQLSGIKELKRSFVNESQDDNNDEFDSNPIELRIVPSNDHILPTNSDSGPENVNDDDDLPCTQPVTTILLCSVVAFVDVKIGNLKISDSLKQQLISLGAEVEEKFTRRVTHVIFKDGNLSTYKKAKRWKVPLVSLTWINDCATSLSILPTSKYIPSGLDKYEAKLVNTVEKDLFDINKRAKVYSATKMKKIQNEIKKLNARTENAKQVLPDYDNNRGPLTPEHEKTCKFNIIEEFINNLDGEVRAMINRSESPQSSEDIHIPVPLSLLRKCITPRKAKTDVKEIPSKTSNINLKTSQTRKNLDNLLMPKNSNDGKEDNSVNKENVNSSEEYYNERKSAPSELLTNYKQINKKAKSRKCNDNQSLRNDKNRNYDKVIVDNAKNCIISQQLTQTSRKRQLLPLDQPVNDLITDTLNTSVDQIPVKNPYESPKRKCRKITDKKPSTTKKNFIKPTLRPILHRIDEVSVGEGAKDDSDFSRRSSSAFFASRRVAGKLRAVKMSPTIVCTGLSNMSLETVKPIVEQLGTYVVENNVSDRTTHIVVERENFRTVNLLKGIVRGCWIVSIEWIYSSLEASKWISEEQFEVTSFSPAIRLNRYDRQAFGPEYSFELFNECGPIFVNPNCNPASEDIKELVKLSGGRLVDVQRAATLIIGGKPSFSSRAPRVDEKWVLDCITKLKVLEYDKYVLSALRFS